MQFGAFLWQWRGEDMATNARLAEELGFRVPECCLVTSDGTTDLVLVGLGARVLVAQVRAPLLLSYFPLNVSRGRSLL
jgi:hypothetical protein